MTQVTVIDQIPVSADRLWSLVANFGDVRWMPNGDTVRTEGTGPGMVRILAMGNAEVRERLENCDQAARTIVYTVPHGLPLSISDYRATMAVRPLTEGRSELKWSCTFEPDGVSEAEAKAQVENIYRMMIGWIAAYLAL